MDLRTTIFTLKRAICHKINLITLLLLIISSILICAVFCIEFKYNFLFALLETSKAIVGSPTLPKDVNYEAPSMFHAIFAFLHIVVFFSFYAGVLFILTKSLRGMTLPFVHLSSKSVCVFYTEENRLKTTHPSIILARNISKMNSRMRIDFFRKICDDILDTDFYIKEIVYKTTNVFYEKSKEIKRLWKNTEDLNFFFFDDDFKNNEYALNELLKISKNWNDYRNKFDAIHKKPRVFILTQKAKINTIYNHCEITTINNAKLIAKDFIKKNPPIDFINNGEELNPPFRFLLIGFKEIGQELFKSLFILGRFPNSDGTNRFKAFVTDENAYKLKDEFTTRYPSFKKEEYIDFCQCAYPSEKFENFTNSAILKAQCLIVALDEDSSNIEIAQKLKILMKKQNKDIRIFVYQKNDSSTIEEFEIFGTKETIYQSENILNKKIRNAQYILNEFYKKINKKTKKDWEQLDEMQRENNEYSILSIGSKIKLLELLNKNDIEYLSEYEHLRWEGFYYTKGWTLKEIDLKDKRKRFKAGDEKDCEKQEHMCLRSWQDLEELNKIFEDSKSHTAFNRNVSRNLQYLINEIGTDI